MSLVSDQNDNPIEASSEFKKTANFWVARALISATPVIMIVSIGVSHRIAPEVSVAPEYGITYHKKLNAYVAPLRLTYTSLNLDGGLKSVPEFNKLSDTWINLFRSGELKAIPPVYGDDDSRKGVKNEILTARHRVSSTEFQFAKDETDPQQKIYHIFRALEIEKIGREFDISAILNAMKFENNVFELLIAIESETPNSLNQFNLKRIIKEYDADLVLKLVRSTMAASLDHAYQESGNPEFDNFRQKADKALVSDDQLGAIRELLETSSLELGSTCATLRQIVLELKSRKQLLTALRTLRVNS